MASTPATHDQGSSRVIAFFETFIPVTLSLPLPTVVGNFIYRTYISERVATPIRAVLPISIIGWIVNIFGLLPVLASLVPEDKTSVVTTANTNLRTWNAVLIIVLWGTYIPANMFTASLAVMILQNVLGFDLNTTANRAMKEASYGASAVTIALVAIMALAFAIYRVVRFVLLRMQHRVRRDD